MVDRIAVVTGGNKGIGLEVCRQLATDGIIVVLTARDEKRGTEAVEKLKEARLSNVNNAAVGGVEYVQDHVAVSETSDEKVRPTSSVMEKPPRTIYLFTIGACAIQFSASGMDGAKRLERMWQNSRETYDAAKAGLETNYYGTKHVIEALLPLLQASDDARIVNVSSEWGRLKVS
ncbi:hypothetical protein PR202_ga19569 [Eleusine coracana subsp. coracana]|uniref:Uncharacterized protein n=1 Tax=Eleusine coracana subsp. coracana TaxID=191504 RepID=A0AAV5CVX8_ELECO|nr:hypothetical protein PR202_ga19569 [Eleusine coracana subsp. coracana]